MEPGEMTKLATQISWQHPPPTKIQGILVYFALLWVPAGDILQLGIWNFTLKQKEDTECRLTMLTS